MKSKEACLTTISIQSMDPLDISAYCLIPLSLVFLILLIINVVMKWRLMNDGISKKKKKKRRDGLVGGRNGPPSTGTQPKLDLNRQQLPPVYPSATNVPNVCLWTKFCCCFIYLPRSLFSFMFVLHLLFVLVSRFQSKLYLKILSPPSLTLSSNILAQFFLSLDR